MRRMAGFTVKVIAIMSSRAATKSTWQWVQRQ
jgi:hypothetical protein